jgi:hypothetical protein
MAVMREFFFFANIPYELDDENGFPSFAEFDSHSQEHVRYPVPAVWLHE